MIEGLYQLRLDVEHMVDTETIQGENVNIAIRDLTQEGRLELNNDLAKIDAFHGTKDAINQAPSEAKSAESDSTKAKLQAKPEDEFNIADHASRVARVNVYKSQHVDKRDAQREALNGGFTAKAGGNIRESSAVSEPNHLASGNKNAFFQPAQSSKTKEKSRALGLKNEQEGACYAMA